MNLRKPSLLKTVLSLVICSVTFGVSCNALLHAQNGGFVVSANSRISYSSDILSSSSSLISYSANSNSVTRLYASSSTSSSSKKKTKNKTKSNKKSTNIARNPGPGRSLTRDEISDHVSTKYLDGREIKLQSRGIADENSSSNNEKTNQDKYLRELNSRSALVLNADYQPLNYLPLSLWSWQDAVKAVFSGKVTVVDVYPDITIRAVNLEIPLPSVIALNDYVPHLNSRPAFTRRNVFLRDEYKCQYCNDHFHTADLSLDHVHPRCMGGQLNWENAVTSCLKCNGRKGSLQLSELRHVGMRLVREPKCPTQMELAAKAARMVPRRVHPTWKPYLGIAEKPTTGIPKAKLQGDEAFIDDRYFEESA